MALDLVLTPLSAFGFVVPLLGSQISQAPSRTRCAFDRALLPVLCGIGMSPGELLPPATIGHTSAVGCSTHRVHNRGSTVLDRGRFPTQCRIIRLLLFFFLFFFFSFVRFSWQVRSGCSNAHSLWAYNPHTGMVRHASRGVTHFSILYPFFFYSNTFGYHPFSG